MWGGCSLLGLGTSFLVSRVPAGDPARKFRFNLFADLGAQWKLVRPDRALKLAVVGNTYFWSLGALLQFVVVFYGREILLLDETHGSYLQAGVAGGRRVGCFFAGVFFRGENGFVFVSPGGIRSGGFLL